MSLILVPQLEDPDAPVLRSEQNILYWREFDQECIWHLTARCNEGGECPSYAMYENLFQRVQTKIAELERNQQHATT